MKCDRVGCPHEAMPEGFVAPIRARVKTGDEVFVSAYLRLCFEDRVAFKPFKCFASVVAG